MSHVEEESPAILFCCEGKFWFTSVSTICIAQVPLPCKNLSLVLPESTEPRNRICVSCI